MSKLMLTAISIAFFLGSANSFSENLYIKSLMEAKRLSSIGDYSKALNLLNHELKECVVVFGEDDINCVMIYSSIAYNLVKMGDIEESYKYNELAKKGIIKNNGIDSYELAIFYFNLGTSYENIDIVFSKENFINSIDILLNNDDYINDLVLVSNEVSNFFLEIEDCDLARYYSDISLKYSKIVDWNTDTVISNLNYIKAMCFSGGDDGVKKAFFDVAFEYAKKNLRNRINTEIVYYYSWQYMDENEACKWVTILHLGEPSEYVRSPFVKAYIKGDYGNCIRSDNKYLAKIKLSEAIDDLTSLQAYEDDINYYKDILDKL
ncbi:hypothetical protein [Vibrio sp. PNB22_8_1]|uniref:hypothetical protein n=1 Tax=unclassified Vibrio TaxID=2614977 RepID=UPI00406A5BE5